MIFKDPEEFEVGDFLMGYDNTQFRGMRNTYKLDNSNDFRVKHTTKASKGIGGIVLKGWDLELYDYDRDEDIKVFCISRDNNLDDLQALAEKIELIRQDAVMEKEKLVQKQL